MNAFDLILQQASKAELTRIAKKYDKHIEECENKLDLAGLLRTTMSRSQKTQELQSRLLAGVGSMTLFRFLDPSVEVTPEPNFTEASGVPSIVAVGERGELFDNQTHIVWAVVSGMNSYVDKHLDLRVDPEAAIVSTFYDHANGLLQARANAQISRKISRVWADMAGVEPNSEIVPLGLRDVDEVHGFADLIDAAVAKCGGNKVESGGFHRVTGQIHPNVADLRGTNDYESFLESTEATDFDLTFTYDEDTTVKLGAGLTTQSLVFRTAVNESVVQFVYKQLKQYLDSQGRL